MHSVFSANKTCLQHAADCCKYSVCGHSLISFTDNVETAAVTMETEEGTEAREAAPAC